MRGWRAGHELLANSALTRILGMLWRESEVQADRSSTALALACSARGDTDPLITRVLAYMAEHLGEHLTLSGLAWVAHLSPSRFSDRFRAAVGSSPFAYLREVRLARARELLTGTELSAAEVARLAGFRDRRHFTRVFRRAEGVTPSRFRSAASDEDA